MSKDIAGINDALKALALDFSEGRIGAAELRQRRRELICSMTGQALPQLENDASGEATHPGLPPVSVAPAPDDDGEGGDVAGPAPVASARAGYWWITALTILVALAGVAGLLWFVFRKG